MSANTFLPPAITIPGSLIITAISQGYPMQVTFTDDDENTYIPGQLVKLFIPSSYGMQQANGLQGRIMTIIDNVFYLDIDSTYFDIFSVPSGILIPQPASMAPAGSRNLEYNNDANRVGFQNLFNSGN